MSFVDKDLVKITDKMDNLSASALRKLYKLEKPVFRDAVFRYAEIRVEMRLAWLIWFFGFHYVQIKKYRSFVIFLIFCLILPPIGVLIWLFQAVDVVKNTRKLNSDKLLEAIRRAKENQ